MNWALIGASTIAEHDTIDAICAQNAGDIISVVSGSQARAARFATDHGIPNASSDLEQTLQDPRIDAVYISSTNGKHHGQALAAIAAGKHVSCEKPLAMTRSDACETVTSATAAGVTFATNHYLRCAGSHRTIRFFVADGTIGQVPSMVMSHDGFTHPSAESGVTAHGTKGSILAKSVLGQDPDGAIELISKDGHVALPFAKHSNYGETIHQFMDAATGQGAPAATGVDGVKSLAVALAVRDAARSGTRQIVEYGVDA